LILVVVWVSRGRVDRIAIGILLRLRILLIHLIAFVFHV